MHFNLNSINSSYQNSNLYNAILFTTFYQLWHCLFYLFINLTRFCIAFYRKNLDIQKCICSARKFLCALPINQTLAGVFLGKIKNHAIKTWLGIFE